MKTYRHIIALICFVASLSASASEATINGVPMISKFESSKPIYGNGFVRIGWCTDVDLLYIYTEIDKTITIIKPSGDPIEKIRIDIYPFDAATLQCLGKEGFVVVGPLSSSKAHPLLGIHMGRKTSVPLIPRVVRADGTGVNLSRIFSHNEESGAFESLLHSAEEKIDSCAIAVAKPDSPVSVAAIGNGNILMGIGSELRMLRIDGDCEAKAVNKAGGENVEGTFIDSITGSQLGFIACYYPIEEPPYIGYVAAYAPGGGLIKDLDGAVACERTTASKDAMAIVRNIEDSAPRRLLAGYELRNLPSRADVGYFELSRGYVQVASFLNPALKDVEAKISQSNNYLAILVTSPGQTTPEIKWGLTIVKVR